MIAEVRAKIKEEKLRIKGEENGEEKDNLKEVTPHSV